MEITKQNLSNLFEIKNEITHNHKKGELSIEFLFLERPFKITNHHTNDLTKFRLYCDWFWEGEYKSQFVIGNNISELISKLVLYFKEIGKEEIRSDMKILLGLND